MSTISITAARSASRLVCMVYWHRICSVLFSEARACPRLWSPHQPACGYTAWTTARPGCFRRTQAWISRSTTRVFARRCAGRDPAFTRLEHATTAQGAGRCLTALSGLPAAATRARLSCVWQSLAWASLVRLDIVALCICRHWRISPHSPDVCQISVICLTIFSMRRALVSGVLASST